MTENRRIGFKVLAAYGVGGRYGGGSFLIIFTLFLFFLTDVIGLLPALVGLVLFAGKDWDAISDPLMGCISDRTRSRRGRAPRLLPHRDRARVRQFCAFMGVGPDGRPSIDVPILFPGVYPFCTVFTMIMVPYAALPTEMTTDYRDRTRLSGARMNWRTERRGPGRFRGSSPWSGSSCRPGCSGS